MRQIKQGNQYYLGAKAQIGADDESDLVHSVVVTAANVADITQIAKLLHGEENVVCSDADYTGVEKRKEHAGRKVFGRFPLAAALTKSTENAVFCTSLSAKSRRPRPRFAKIKHPFRVIKRQFSYGKVPSPGLVKNTAQMVTLFDQPNLWTARRYLLANAGEVRG